MDKEHRTRKYTKNKRPSRHTGWRKKSNNEFVCRNVPKLKKCVRREKSKVTRRLMNDYLFQQRLGIYECKVPEFEGHCVFTNWGKTIHFDIYSLQACSCEGFDEDGFAYCPCEEWGWHEDFEPHTVQRMNWKNTITDRKLPTKEWRKGYRQYQKNLKEYRKHVKRIKNLKLL
jgi:hypothetical protein